MLLLVAEVADAVGVRVHPGNQTLPALRVETHVVGLPTVPSHCEQGYHMYYLLLPSLRSRKALLAHLEQRRIHSVFHYTPLHLSKMGRSFGGADSDCAVTERISDGLLRLPFHNGLTSGDQERVVGEIRAFFKQ